MAIDRSTHGKRVHYCPIAWTFSLPHVRCCVYNPGMSEKKHARRAWQFPSATRIHKIASAIVMTFGLIAFCGMAAPEATVAAFGFAFVAFWVWLTLRIINRRERWAKRTAIYLAVTTVFYPI